MANDSANARKNQNCRFGGICSCRDPRQVEAVAAGADGAVQIRETENRQQHQHAAAHRVQNELDRRVDAALVAPDPDEEVHRDEHRVPEDVEEEQIERDEHADHRALEQQHEDAERPGVLVHRFPRSEERERRQKSGQHQEQQADAVHADEIADPERRDPRVALDELKVGRRRIEPRPEQQRLEKHQHRHDERAGPQHGPMLLVVFHEEQQDRADDRQHDQRGENRKGMVTTGH